MVLVPLFGRVTANVDFIKCVGDNQVVKLDVSVSGFNIGYKR